MEAYILNKLFQTTKIVDVFTSFIWDEPYIGYGTFELVFPMDPFIMAGVEEGYYVTIRESKRYMIIESIDVRTDVEDGDRVTLSGRSLESILLRRVIRYDILELDKLETLVRRCLNANVIVPEEEHRAIGTIAYVPTQDPTINGIEIAADVKKGAYVYNVILEHCEAHNVGFRLLPDRENENGFMKFELYLGVDRSYNQEVVPYVIFSPKYDNLNNSSMLIDTQDYRNVIISEHSYVLKTLDYWTAKLDENGNQMEGLDGHKLYTAVYKEEEITETHEYGDINDRNLDRREAFFSKSFDIGFVDRDKFGRGEDFVDMWKYLSPILVSYDMDSFRKDTESWSITYNNSKPRRKEEWRRERVPKADYDKLVNDPKNYDANGNFTAQIMTVQKVLWQENEADFNKRLDAYNAMMEGTEPKLEDYAEYEWGMTAEAQAAYEAEVAKENERIEKEYQEALDAEYQKMMAVVKEESLMELSKYHHTKTFEGEVDYKVNFIFGRDYFMGDIVQIVDKYGFQGVTRITSIMFSQDSNSGMVMIPTFKADKEVVDLDSWYPDNE